MDASTPSNPRSPGAGDGSSPENGQSSLAGFTPALRQEDHSNVLRVPFGVRLPRRRRPKRADTWATLVIPFQIGGGGPHPTPPWAA
jgi:hypothetical protein